MSHILSTPIEAAAAPAKRCASFVLAALLAAWACQASSPMLLAQEKDRPEKFKKAVIIPMEGPITPMLQKFLYRRLDTAREMGADLVIVRIDSPGGLVDESFEIADRFRTLDWATTVAYVPEMALSGAAIAALGFDEIVMHPEARMGDAGPIIFGEDALFRHAPEKLVSDLAVRIRALAKSSDRPPALAEAMVNRNVEVFEATNKQTGEKTFMSEAELNTADNPDDWEKGQLVFESRKDHFLEVEGERAVELGLAEATVGGIEGLKKRYPWDGELTTLEHTWVDTTVYVLNSSWVTFLLLIVGLVCLYIEFSAPGTGVGGTIAGICFVLFFWSRVLGGTAGWLEVLLFLSGAALVLVEIFLVPGFGFPGITGGLLIVASIVMASQRFVIPRSNYDMGQLINSLAVMVGSGIGFIALAFLLRRHFRLIPAFNSLVLAPPEPEEFALASPGPAASTREWLLGKEGLTASPLRPAGMARFDGELIDVYAEGTYIAPGVTVKVAEIRGNRVIVVEV